MSADPATGTLTTAAGSESAESVPTGSATATNVSGQLSDAATLSLGQSYWTWASQLLQCSWQAEKETDCEFYHSLLLCLVLCIFVSLVLIRLAWKTYGQEIREMFMKSKQIWECRRFVPL